MAFSHSIFSHGRSLSARARKGAGVAQLAEQPICNRQVAGSSPIASSIPAAGRGSEEAGFVKRARGQMAEWLMAADCKSAALSCYGGSNPSLPKFRAYQGGRDAHVAQSVEHVLGKDGVSSSNLLVGSRKLVGTQTFIGTRGSNSGVESQPSKLLVAGSNPVSRSRRKASGRPRKAERPETHHAERAHQPDLRRLQAAQLHGDEEQEDAPGEARGLEILPGVPQAHVPQGRKGLTSGGV